MLKPSLVKDRVMNSETWGLAKWWVRSGTRKGLPKSWPVAWMNHSNHDFHNTHPHFTPRD